MTTLRAAVAGIAYLASSVMLATLFPHFKWNWSTPVGTVGLRLIPYALELLSGVLMLGVGVWLALYVRKRQDLREVLPPGLAMLSLGVIAYAGAGLVSLIAFAGASSTLPARVVTLLMATGAACVLWSAATLRRPTYRRIVWVGLVVLAGFFLDVYQRTSWATVMLHAGVWLVAAYLAYRGKLLGSDLWARALTWSAFAYLAIAGDRMLFLLTGGLITGHGISNLCIAGVAVSLLRLAQGSRMVAPRDIPKSVGTDSAGV